VVIYRVAATRNDKNPNMYDHNDDELKLVFPMLNTLHETLVV
jgi:hypothetical protein